MPEGRGTDRPRSVAVCVCTYARPKGLRRLLEALAATIPAGLVRAPDPVAVRVVVVDNEPTAPAATLVRSAAAEAPWPLDYVVEPRRGIAQARNAAVRACDGTADYIAFIDDDETPQDGWLQELLRIQWRTDADVVTGPVFAAFETEPPRWIVMGRFFDRPRHRNGERIHYATTSNVLVGKAVLGLSDPPFDERHPLAGGEDTFFFRQAHLAGRSIVWADRAHVDEVIPASKTCLGWLVRREYRRGLTLSNCLVALEDSRRRRIKRAAHAALATLHGLGLCATGIRGRARPARGLQRIAFAAGLLGGLAGKTYDEYATVHGS